MSPPATDGVTRASWDAVAQEYARLLPDLSPEAPLDRAVLSAYTEMLTDLAPVIVAEVGCGTGRVTRHLHDAGVPMVGFDLSPRMTAVAKATHPELPFAAAHAAALPLRSATLGGLVAWYSLINMPTEWLSSIFVEFARVTRAGAPVLVAFQSGEGQRVDRSTSYGLPVTLTYYRHSADAATEALTAAGFTLYASVTRAAALSYESTAQTALLAHRDDA
jgi:ubiquinone/menaquinone biosynthesis C-methylase UbiE